MEAHKFRVGLHAVAVDGCGPSGPPADRGPRCDDRVEVGPVSEGTSQVLAR